MPHPDRCRRSIAAATFFVALAVTASVSIADDGLDAGRNVRTAADTMAAVAPAMVEHLGTTARYAPISPIRVLDTRTDPVRRRLSANGSVSMAPVTTAVSTASGVAAAQAQAVVVNITMVDSGGAGFASVWPTGSPQPTVSSLNTDFASQNVANLVTVPLGVDGFISLFSSTGADYVIDVQGVYASASSARAGRLVPLDQRRAIDTRPGAPFGGNTLGAQASLTLDLKPFGVPADATAAVLNVTATNTAGPGYFTVWPGGTAMPLASNLNVPAPGHTVANQVIAGLGNGTVSVYSEAGGDVIVDVSGYITGPGAPSTSTGLYVPLTPARLLDTRSPGPFSSGQPLGSGISMALPVAGRGGVAAAGVQSVALNVTATRTHAQGYVTGWPANTPMPATSSVNFVAAGRTVPNHMIASLNGGAINFASVGGNDLLVDLMGYWTDGSPSPPPPAPPTALTINTVNAPATTLAPPAPAAVGPHGFLYDRPGGLYGRWDPCSPIVYVVNADRADQGMVDQMNMAIAEIEKATGLDFVYGGPTSTGLDYTTPSGADAVFGFSDAAATPDLAGGVIGVGGGTFDPSSGRVGTGFAFADVNGVVSSEKLRATFMHEIAHMVGLDHVGDPTQLMYSFATPISTFQGGDLQGLWRVGAAQGCLAGDPAADPTAVADQTPSGPGGPQSAEPGDTVLVVQT